MKITKCILLLWLGYMRTGHNLHVEPPPAKGKRAQPRVANIQLFRFLVKVKF